MQVQLIHRFFPKSKHYKKICRVLDLRMQTRGYVGSKPGRRKASCKLQVDVPLYGAWRVGIPNPRVVQGSTALLLYR